ncbi:sugar transferase [Aestuariibius sp. 2305UL40-4]|uniref:sugar transferase n=1 Tax=Aestuariibius violaceus TaxID=3234132 RepID=UPI00345EDD52
MTAGKRLFDLGLASVLTIALAPLWLGLAMLILVKDGRPVLFLSERMKTPHESFNLWKFRTMRVADDPGTGVSGGDKTERITATGTILRRIRADEIPQLFNVLRGDLSFVGPRPPLRVYVERFPDLYADVLSCRPGITGLATLVFARHEAQLLAACRTPQETDAVYARRCVPRKARLDRIYARNRSFTLDLWILTQTLRLVAGGRLRRPSRQGWAITAENRPSNSTG